MATMKSELLREIQSLKPEIQAVLAEVRHVVEDVRTAVKVHELEHHK
jgi:hypothetical protein